ncbi:MAG: hypothetical protein KBD56_05105 [Candidatus Eisenbacteria bacterium]|nr:hypothetical protein [Candidatus Eisenbacteria bacterium]
MIGCYLGTDPTGRHARPNQRGVLMYTGAQQNMIGGWEDGEHNVILGNTLAGVEVQGVARIGYRLPALTSLASSPLASAPLAPAELAVRLFDATGRCVRVVLDANPSAGSGEIVWDGRDEVTAVAASSARGARGWHADRECPPLRRPRRNRIIPLLGFASVLLSPSSERFVAPGRAAPLAAARRGWSSMMVSRMVFHLCGPLLGILLVLVSATGRANPVPSDAFYIHVHPVAPDFCSEDPVSDCSDIEQFTYERGELEFDVYLVPWEPVEEYLNACELNVSWPPSWQYLGWEPCRGGSGQADVSQGGGRFQIQWPCSWWDGCETCPVTQGDVTLLARFVLNVVQFGTLGVPHGTISYGCPDAGDPVVIDGSYGGSAGVSCAHCVHECRGIDEWCYMSPWDLYFEVPPGGISAPQPINVPDDSPWYPPAFECTEPWILQDIEYVQDHWVIWVSVNTMGMDPGEYEGFVTCAYDQCVKCATIHLTVQDSQTETESTTWGRTKTSFR